VVSVFGFWLLRGQERLKTKPSYTFINQGSTFFQPYSTLFNLIQPYSTLFNPIPKPPKQSQHPKPVLRIFAPSCHHFKSNPEPVSKSEILNQKS
jgi:hypothetical protein